MSFRTGKTAVYVSSTSGTTSWTNLGTAAMVATTAMRSMPRSARRKPTGVEDPADKRLNFCLMMFRRRKQCFNHGSERHIHWLLRTRDACAKTIARIDDELARVFGA